MRKNIYIYSHTIEKLKYGKKNKKIFFFKDANVCDVGAEVAFCKITTF